MEISSTSSSRIVIKFIICNFCFTTRKGKEIVRIYYWWCIIDGRRGGNGGQRKIVREITSLLRKLLSISVSRLMRSGQSPMNHTERIDYFEGMTSSLSRTFYLLRHFVLKACSFIMQNTRIYLSSCSSFLPGRRRNLHMHYRPQNYIERNKRCESRGEVLNWC